MVSKYTTISIVGFALGCGVCSGQIIPRVCESPDQWEGRATSYRFQYGTTLYSYVAFDAVNERIFEKEEILSGGQAPGKKYYEIIRMYRERLQYKIDINTRKCYKSSIPGNQLWRPFGVPKNATFMQQVNIGVVGEGITANEFQMLPKDHPTGALYRGIFTAKDCAPLQEQTFGADPSDINEIILTEYFDIVLGISNPNVFFPPQVCETVTSEVFASL